MILEYRKKHGNFKKLGDLGKVHGISKKMLSKLAYQHNEQFQGYLYRRLTLNLDNCKMHITMLHEKTCHYVPINIHRVNYLLTLSYHSMYI